MSRNALDPVGPHTYLDDLESFYFVWCWILVAFEGPGKPKAETPKHIALWDHPASSLIKYSQLNRDLKLPIAPWFGNSLHRLAVHLHGFFEFRFHLIGKPLSALHPTKHYDEFLAHIQQSITDLEEETEPTPEFPRSKLSEAVRQLSYTGSGKRSRETVSNEPDKSYGPIRHPSRVRRYPIPPVKRSRRCTANYD